jgi:hypothetical protein
MAKSLIQKYYMEPLNNDSHISIAMPDGTSCRAFIDFDVYNTDYEGGKIIRLQYEAIGSLFLIVAAHKNPTGKAAQTLKKLEAIYTGEIASDLSDNPPLTATSID